MNQGDLGGRPIAEGIIIVADLYPKKGNGKKTGRCCQDAWEKRFGTWNETPGGANHRETHEKG